MDQGNLEKRVNITISEDVAIARHKRGGLTLVPIYQVVMTPAGLQNVVGVSYAVDPVEPEGEIATGTMVAHATNIHAADEIVDGMIASLVRFIMGGKEKKPKAAASVVPDKPEVVVTPEQGLRAITEGRHTPPAPEPKSVEFDQANGIQQPAEVSLESREPQEQQPAEAPPTNVDLPAQSAAPAKRGRGRPPGSKNKPSDTDLPPERAELESQPQPGPSAAETPAEPKPLPIQVDEVPNPANKLEGVSQPHPIERCRATRVPADFVQKGRAGKTLGELAMTPGGIAWIKWAAKDFVVFLQTSGVQVRKEHTDFQATARELVQIASL